MIRVFYDAGALFIDGRDDPVMARTLVATASGSTISILSLHSSNPLVACDFSLIAAIDGSGFGSVADCLAYLAAQFAMQRSIDIPTATGVATLALQRGMPTAVSRANGQLIAARADTVGACLVAGLASDDVAAGFVGSATRNPVALPDWTSIAGTPSLAVGQAYFLAATGGMMLTPPAAPDCVCSVRLGQATSAQTFLFLQSYPIRL